MRDCVSQDTSLRYKLSYERKEVNRGMGIREEAADTRHVVDVRAGKDLDIKESILCFRD